MGIATRLAALERKVKGGKARTKSGKVIGYDWRETISPEMRAKTFEDERGLMWYMPTAEEWAEVERILTEAHTMAGTEWPSEAATPEDVAPVVVWGERTASGVVKPQATVEAPQLDWSDGEREDDIERRLDELHADRELDWRQPRWH